MSDRTPGEREVAAQRAEDPVRRVEIRPAEDAVDPEFRASGQRGGHRLRCCTHHFQVTDTAPRANPIGEPRERPARHSDVLEADVAHAELRDGIDDLLGVLDRPVVAGQHEDEVHSVLPAKARPAPGGVMLAH